MLCKGPAITRDTICTRRIGHEVYKDNPPPEPSEFMDNHTWFNKGVTRWLDIALYKVYK